ncbi:MAG: hypothetical protein CVT73_07165 [Alphaproteobacteria bacterium HGW-Alphaproteobacteria-12]|nr:MAG: hypothetical protein CVT73_07165 [Alphaproteobacteria bacterium HGW-Alphaproteobacteria-12]
MKRFEQSFAPWNAMRFAVTGAIFGTAYGFGMGAIVGVLTLSTIDLLFWGVISTAAFGAIMAGGVAVLRNQLACWLMQSRKERSGKTGVFPAGLRLRDFGAGARSGTPLFFRSESRPRTP